MANRAEPLNRVLVITPTYNEAENIESIITRLRTMFTGVHALIVDDNSPDGTGEIADRLAANDPFVHVLHRTAKNGLAAAYLAGFAWGLENDFDVLVEMDADGSHDPKYIAPMLQAMREGADMVKGSRWMKGGSTDQTKPREFLSRAANAWVQGFMDLPVKDATGGFNAFRASMLREIDLGSVDSRGYTFQIDMTRRVLQAGGQVAEVPIYFPDRTLGESKMNGAIIGEALIKTAAWGTVTRKRQLGELAMRAGRVAGQTIAAVKQWKDER